MTALTDLHKAALKKFREQQKQRGEDPGKYAARFRQQRKAIATALKPGPATVPQLAQATSLPAHEVLWHLAGMRKYGEVQETGQAGDYMTYALTSQGGGAPESEKE